MPQVTPLGALRASFTDKCGRLLAGGKIYTYEENSLTPKITYADFTGVVPNTNPIVLDRSGEADIFLDGSYRFQIFDRFGTLIHDINNVRDHFKDQIKSYFVENILAAGGLPENSAADYDYLMQQLAQIAVDNGWDASFIVDGDKNQKQINNILIHSVKSISELRSYKKRFPSQEVLVLAHTSDYCGGGSFYNDNNHVGVDNNGTIIIANNGDKWIRKDKREITPEMFGAMGVDATIDTLATQKAFSASKSLAFYRDLTLNNTVLIDKNYTSIKFHNAIINSTLTDKTLFDVNAEHCSVNSVNSKVISPSGVWVGTQVTPSYAVFFVRKNYFKMKGLEVQNFYRFAVALSNSTYHDISGNIFDGGITEELTAELTSDKLSRGAVQYDPPSAVSHPDPSLLLFGNKVRNDIQGFLAGNYGAKGAEGGIRVIGNDFYQLKDHTVYFDGISSGGSVIVGNTAIDCRRPFVCGGVGTVLANNTCKSEKSSIFYEQFVALRDAKDCVVSNNTIVGYGASIGFFNIVTGNNDITGNIISNNTIKSSANSSVASAIKIYNATTISKNSITNNTIDGYSSRFGGVVSIIPNSGGGGFANSIRGNKITVKNLCYASYCLYAETTFDDNEIYLEVNSDAVETMDLIFGLYKSIDRNKFYVKTGFGANINVRGINLNNFGAATIKGNTFDFSSPDLLSKAYILNAGASIVKDNIYDVTQPIMGTLSIASGVATAEINNPNILTTSFVDLQPLNAASATATYFVAYANGKLTVTLSSAAASALSFRYNIS